MDIDFGNHPCFNKDARHTSARIHLPVAPRCNIQCNYCRRDYDCVNESRPGVTSKVLSPEQALLYLNEMMERNPNITVVGIAGPGDPFANPNETMETLRLVREAYPDMILCLATNGLNLLPYIDELAELKVSHVTLTMNAVDPEVVEQIYTYMRYDKKLRRMPEAAPHFLKTQFEAIERLHAHDILVKINSIVIPGINEAHIPEVAEKVKELGADIFNVMGLLPTKGTVFGKVKAPSFDLIKEVRKKAAEFLPQMAHCMRCRADAVGILGEKNSDDANELMDKYSKTEIAPKLDLSVRDKIAVASMEGVLVNQHLGEAERFYIYENSESGPRLYETRIAPEKGGGDTRWKELANLLSDCSAVLVNGVGNHPKGILEESGLQVYLIEGMIEEAVSRIYNNQSLTHLSIRKPPKCQEACTGNGTGCG